MDEDTATVVRLVAVQGAVVAAAIHLAEGLPRLVTSLSLWLFNDPRPYLFVPSGLLLLAVSGAVAWRWHVREASAVGLVIAMAYLAGYAWWHLTGHGGNAPAHETTDPVGEIVFHLLADPVALVAYAAELSAVVAFAVLLVAGGTDPAVEADTAE